MQLMMDPSLQKEFMVTVMTSEVTLIKNLPEEQNEGPVFQKKRAQKDTKIPKKRDLPFKTLINFNIRNKTYPMLK